MARPIAQPPYTPIPRRMRPDQRLRRLKCGSVPWVGRGPPKPCAQRRNSPTRGARVRKALSTRDAVARKAPGAMPTAISLRKDYYLNSTRNITDDKLDLVLLVQVGWENATLRWSSRAQATRPIRIPRFLSSAYVHMCSELEFEAAS
jgi:hypothetical protein